MGQGRGRSGEGAGQGRGRGTISEGACEAGTACQRDGTPHRTLAESELALPARSPARLPTARPPAGATHLVLTLRMSTRPSSTIRSMTMGMSNRR